MTDRGKAKEMTGQVLRRFSGHQWLTFQEASLGSRRADVLALNLYRSEGWAVHGVEVKVSRADWMSELRNPAKSADLIKFVDLWWIAAPKGMIHPEELPPGWGLFEPRSDGVLWAKVQAVSPDIFEPFDREVAVRFILKTLDQGRKNDQR